MNELLLFFLFITAFITMTSLFTPERRVQPHNQTQFIHIPHGVYYLPHGGRRCKNDCTLVEFDGFP